MKPLCIDLYAGLGGWAEGFLAEGYDVIGFDIERHDYGPVVEHAEIGPTGTLTARVRPGGYPGQLVLQDVLTLDGAQLARLPNLCAIVGSSPCQKYSWMAMPWKRAKAAAAWYRDSDHPERIIELNALFDAQFRIQREASEAAGRYIPLVVENVKGAQPWVGRAAWHYGSYYLWGDVPALMPFAGKFKSEGMNWSDQSRRGQDFTRIAGQQTTKNNGGSWFNQAYNTESGVGRNPDGRKGTGGSWMTPDPDMRTPGHWKESGCVTRCFNSKDSRRKAASAQIAKIPFELARHIAAVLQPHEPSAVCAPETKPAQSYRD